MNGSAEHLNLCNSEGNLNSAPRVAFFPDSFYEVNGVAHTSRHFEAFAKRRNLPFLNVHAGPADSFAGNGNLQVMELRTSRAGVPLETDLTFDPLFLRHLAAVKLRLHEFRADLVHVTGPSHIGILGVLAARHAGLPLVASWHTNLHEYAARRMGKTFSLLPSGLLGGLASAAEQSSLRICVEFYKLAALTLAPNPELVNLLHARTGKPSFLMSRGVDTELFSPAKRDPAPHPLTIGYAGRLSPEKSVRVLRDVEQALLAAGVASFRILIVGDGAERDWLSRHLSHVEFAGVLKGEALARAFAGMDIFAFPSRTDTFGNVVQEAMASGVPSVVTSQGGPRYIVSEGITGLITESDADFAAAVARLATQPDLRNQMSLQCRESALARSWDRIFEDVYEAYRTV